jgi:tetratricopeptide (TPR) repeat protein
MRTLMLCCAVAAIVGCQQWQSRNLNADGVTYYRQGQYEAAASMFAEAARTDPQNVDAYYNLAASRHQLAKLSKTDADFRTAEQYYRYALSGAPQHADCHRGLAALLVDSNRTKDAEDHLVAWARQTPTSAQPMIELARLKTQLGRRDEAVALLREAALIDPTRTEALVYLGQLQEQTGDVQSALASYQMALQQDPRQTAIAQRVALLRQQALLGPSPQGNTQMATQPGGTTNR